MTKQELIKAIRAAFPEAGMPAPDNIVTGHSGESISVKAVFAGKRWTDVSRDALIRENAALGYLSDDAFRYYLPVYMLLLLEDLDAADILASALVRQLSLPLEVDTLRLAQALNGSPNMSEALNEFLAEELRFSSQNAGAFIQRMRGFTSRQGEVINDFLLFLSREHADYYDEREPAIASERYWFQFGPQAGGQHQVR